MILYALRVFLPDDAECYKIKLLTVFIIVIILHIFTTQDMSIIITGRDDYGQKIRQ